MALGIRPARALGVALLALALIVSGPGCGRGSPTPSGQPSEPTIVPAGSSESPYAAFAARAVGAGLEIIEAAEDGRVLAGVRLPVPARSSAKLVFEARLFDGSGRERSLPLGSPLQDARFAPAPSRRLALLDDSGALVVWDGDATEPVPVDTGVYVGFALSHSGRLLAYSKGSPPELDAYVHDLDTGRTTQLTEGGHPVWGFAFSLDDSRVVFVDSRSGFPTLLMMAPDGTSPALLTGRGLTAEQVRAGRALEPFPDGRRPPLWSRRALYVEDAVGVHAFDAQGKLLMSRPGAQQLHRGTVPGTVLFRDGDRYWRAP